MGSRQPRQYANLSIPRTRWDLRVELPEDGMRLDRFLAKRVKWRSRNELQKLIDERIVHVDGVPRKASTRLRTGCNVVIEIPEPENAPNPRLIPVDVLLDDGELLLVNKQAGIVVHPVNNYLLENLLSALHARYRHPDPALDRVPHVCHRIDRNTSGAFLVAFSEKLKRDVSLQFEDRAVRKEYLALVHGVPSAAEGEIDEPILMTESRVPQLHVHETGLPSLTRYRVEEAFEDAALVRFFPRTGRTHQIRVHAAHLGHPLLCDTIYGGAGPLVSAVRSGSSTQVERSGIRTGNAETDGAESEGAGSDDAGSDGVGSEHAGSVEQGPEVVLDRCALHSTRLQFRHPGTGEAADLHAPLAPDLARAVERLRAGDVRVPAPTLA